MNRFIAILIVLFVSNSVTFAQDETLSLNWLTNLKEAKQIAKKENKPILLYFTGSDWCSPCKMLKKDFFESSAFVEKSSSFVMVMIDYPRRIDILTEEQLEYNKGIVAEYNKSKTFPNLMILNAKGKILDNISGYSSLRDTSNHFTFINKYSGKVK